MNRDAGKYTSEEIIRKSFTGPLEVCGAAYDSRRVGKGDAFFAVRGLESDGHRYIDKAVENGAAVVFLEDENYCSDSFPWVLCRNTRKVLSGFSAYFYGYPSRDLILVGVTGTNGKTTTAGLIGNILGQTGVKTGVIGTVGVKIGDSEMPASRTTPESADLQELFYLMKEEGAGAVVMEVSSHALDLYRVEDCDFDCAVFTNLTQDHLDYHETMENYFHAKEHLFDLVVPGGTAVINADDAWGMRLAVPERIRKITYGVKNKADFRAEKPQVAPEGASYLLNGGLPVKMRLTGSFNIYNSLAALAAASALGREPETSAGVLAGVSGIPGRFETVGNGGGITVIVDYAHTPDSLENVIRTAVDFARGRVITVFGCGGDRDRTKRPLMGEKAGLYSDYSIVTSDNPRTEEPMDIIEDILPGIAGTVSEEKYMVEPDREKAIAVAVAMAEEGDIVLIAGKGHEDYQEINGVKHHFNDRETAEKYLLPGNGGH